MRSLVERSLVERDSKPLVAGMIALLALAVGCGADGSAPAPSAQETASAAEQTGSQSATMPKGYVRTPFGFLHESCVREVPNGSEVHENGEVWLDGKQIQAPSTCAYPSFRNGVAVVQETHGDVAKQSSALINGWVSSVEAQANNMGVFPVRFNGIESAMTVPQTPTVASFQTLFLFVSLTPADGKAILQPVLQWGNGGVAKWTVASWYVPRGGVGVHSPFVDVTPGESIKGSIRDVRNTCVGTVCKWDVKAWRGNTAIASLRVDSSEAYALAQKGVFEAWNVSSCRQLPSTNGFFMNTKVFEPYDPENVDARFDVAGSLNWYKVMNAVSPSCSFNAVFPNPQTAVLTWLAN